MRISIIVAMDRNAIIGTDTGLPWHLPRDLRRFRELTLGKPVILGRKTHEQIGRPLPGRPNVVLTRNASYVREGVLVAHDVPEALRLAEQEAVRLGTQEVMVIGGSEVYRLLFPFTDRLYLTIVRGREFTGSTTFPEELLQADNFALREKTEFLADANNPYPHDFLILDRVTDGVQPAGHTLQALLDLA